MVLQLSLAPDIPAVLDRQLRHRLVELLGATRRGPLLWYLTGEGVGKGILFLLLIVIASILPTTDYAYINIFISIANIAAIAVGLGLPNAVVRFYFSESDFRATLGTQLAVVATMGAILMIAGVMFRNQLASFLGVPTFVVLAACAVAPAIAIRQSWLASLRARRLARAYAATQLAEPLMICAIIVLLISAVPSDFRLVVTAYAVSVSLVALAGIALWRRHPGLRFSATALIALLSFSAPLILHGLANYALNTYDQIVINQLLGGEPAGIYAYSYRFAMAMVVVSSAFSAMWMPAFLDRIRTPERHVEINRLAWRAFLSASALAIALMVTLPAVAGLMGGERYSQAVPLIPMILYGYVWFVLYTLVVGYALHANRTPWIAAGTFIALALNVALNYALIPRIGIAGAALATTASYGALFVIQASVAWRFGAILPVVRMAMVAVGMLPAVAGLTLWYS